MNQKPRIKRCPANPMFDWVCEGMNWRGYGFAPKQAWIAWYNATLHMR